MAHRHLFSLFMEKSWEFKLSLICALLLVAAPAWSSPAISEIFKPTTFPSCEVVSWRLYYNARRDSELKDLLDRALIQDSVTQSSESVWRDIVARTQISLPEVKVHNVILKMIFENPTNLRLEDLTGVDIEIPSLSWHDTVGQIPDGMKVTFKKDQIAVEIALLGVDYCFGKNVYEIGLNFGNVKVSSLGVLRKSDLKSNASTLATSSGLSTPTQ